MHTEFAGVGIYMCVGIYLHICAPSLQMCVRRVCMYVCIYLHTNAPNPNVGVGLYVCVYMCTSIHICMKRHRVCMQSVRIQIHTCLCLYLAIMYVCVYMFTYMYAEFTRVCVHIYM